jgi:uncharacterized protein (TIGR03000 family)
MYSVVLLAALSTGMDSPDCWRGGSRGWGGYGGGYSCGYSGWGGYGYDCGWGGYGWGGWGGYYGGYAVYPSYTYGGYGTTVVRSTTSKTTTATVRGKPMPAPATIVVNVPRDAKLKVGDQVTKSTGTRRVFVTPPLKPGKNYRLTFTASVQRKGQTVTWDQAVTVRADRETKLTISVPATLVAAR